MANPHKGEVPLEIGGTLYTLRLDFNALCSAEAASGKTVSALIAELQTGSITAMRFLLWAAITWRVDDFTLLKAGELMGDGGLDVVAVALTKAIELTFPPATAVTTENPN